MVPSPREENRMLPTSDHLTKGKSPAKWLGADPDSLLPNLCKEFLAAENLMKMFDVEKVGKHHFNSMDKDRSFAALCLER
jgi:hypothetical protein